MRDQSLIQTIKQIHSFYDENYLQVTSFFIEPGERRFLGSKSNRICRFCEKDETKTNFQLEAHAIPELLGNKSLFSYYECDECNQFFGSGIENDLGNWTKPSRTISRIRGKKGVPSIKKSGTEQGWRVDCDNDSLHFLEYGSEPLLDVDEDKRIIKFELTQDAYTPIAVLKAFVKIGLTLLPQNEVPNFKEALSWIRDPIHSQPFAVRSPIYQIFQPGLMRSDLLVAMVIRRKEPILNLPYAFLILGFANEVYQVHIPCPLRDSAIEGKQVTIPVHLPPGRLDPTRLGRALIKQIDLYEKQPVKGKKVRVVIGFNDMEVISG